jgi:hypothetical protein
MPRDWPDPRWPDDRRPLRWRHIILPAAVAIGSAISFIASLWPG